MKNVLPHYNERVQMKTMRCRILSIRGANLKKLQCQWEYKKTDPLLQFIPAAPVQQYKATRQLGSTSKCVMSSRNSNARISEEIVGQVAKYKYNGQ